MEQKGGKSEEEQEDSSDGYLELLEDDEDWECIDDYFENPVSWISVGWC
jgi:hypothetical protein